MASDTCRWAGVICSGFNAGKRSAAPVEPAASANIAAVTAPNVLRTRPSLVADADDRAFQLYGFRWLVDAFDEVEEVGRYQDREAFAAPLVAMQHARPPHGRRRVD